MKVVKFVIGAIVFTLVIGNAPTVLGNQIEGWVSLQYAKQYHSDIRVMALATSITEEFGAACFTALHDYYGWQHDFSHLTILRDSPLMTWEGFRRMDAALIENVIHVKAGATLDLVHEIRHAIHQQRMGTEFYVFYAEAHTLPHTAGYFFEQQALVAERGFRMNYGPVCADLAERPRSLRLERTRDVTNGSDPGMLPKHPNDTSRVLITKHRGPDSQGNIFQR
jgi:hypothetical protein